MKRFDVPRFGDEKGAQGSDKAVTAKYQQIPAESREDIEAEWRDLRTALSSVADEHLGPRSKGIQPELQSREQRLC